MAFQERINSWLLYCPIAMTKKKFSKKPQGSESNAFDASNAVALSALESEHLQSTEATPMAENDFSEVDFKGSKWIYFMVIGLNIIYVLLFYWINQLYGNS